MIQKATCYSCFFLFLGVAAKIKRRFPSREDALHPRTCSSGIRSGIALAGNPDVAVHRSSDRLIHPDWRIPTMDFG